jgi:streptomycin 6-kinase
VVGALVRQRLERLGEEGARWLADLPSVVEELERRWSLVAGEPLADGSAAYVARVRTVDGRDAVLRIGVPGLDHARQARTIAAADGRGYVRLLAQDPERRAMLLEALGPSLHSLGLPPERVIATLCRTLHEAWTVPRPSGASVDPAEEKARTLGELVSGLWEELGRPCSEAVADQALRFADRRAAAFDLERCVVVHGDPHPANALQILAPRPGAESGYVFVDPDGFLADPTYDLGVVLRHWCPELLAGDAPALAARYCRLLSAETGLDAAAIWEWGFLERVSSGLFILSLGAEDMARPFLTTAELLHRPSSTSS